MMSSLSMMVHSPRAWLAISLTRSLLIFTIVITGALVCANYLILIRGLTFATAPISLFFLLIPPLLPFSLPIAAMCSVGTTWGMVIRQVGAFFISLTTLKRLWYTAVVSLFVIVGAISFCCTTYLGPYAYRTAKERVLKSVPTGLSSLPPGVVTRITPQLSMSCRSSRVDHGVTYLYDVSCICHTKHTQIIRARRLELHHDEAVLADGSLFSSDQDGLHRFKSARLTMHAFLTGSFQRQSFPARYLTLTELNTRNRESDIYEIWRRMILSLWSAFFILWMAFTLPWSGSRMMSLTLPSLFVRSGLFFAAAYTASHSLPHIVSGAAGYVFVLAAPLAIALILLRLRIRAGCVL